MNRPRLIVPLLLALMAPLAVAQEAKTNAATETPSTVPETTLKVQVLVTEYNGTQKLNSLPYIIYIVDSGTRANSGSVRMNTRVPVRTGENSFSYQDTGTDIDCHLIFPTGMNGRYHFSFAVQRSSVVSATGADIKQGEPIPTGQPLIRSSQDSFDVVLRDGQTIEGSSSVDPATGNVMKVDVTLNLEK